MKALTSKTNTVPAGGDYPYGDLKDNPGDNSGTPVDRNLMGDIHRNVMKIMDEGNVIPNNLDDNETNGYQVYEAMVRAIRGYEVTSFIFDPNNTGSEVVIQKNELGLTFTSFTEDNVGVYRVKFGQNIASIPNVFYNSIGNMNPSPSFPFIFDNSGTSEPDTLVIYGQDSSTATPIAISIPIVVEIRKYI